MHGRPEKRGVAVSGQFLLLSIAVVRLVLAGNDFLLFFAGLEVLLVLFVDVLVVSEILLIRRDRVFLMLPVRLHWILLWSCSQVQEACPARTRISENEFLH